MLEKVIVTPEVWQACFNHALTTETEEIMWVLQDKNLTMIMLLDKLQSLQGFVNW